MNSHLPVRTSSALAFLLVIFSNQPIRAQDDDLVVRASISPDERVFVGQRIEMRVDVLARDIWANLPNHGRFDIPGAIVLAPPNASVRLNEQIDGGTFIGQRYELWVYPQRQGQLKIPQQQLNVQLKPFGVDQKPTLKAATTDSFSVEVSYPEGVPTGASIVCTTEFAAEQVWQPDSKNFVVGDGVTRTITRTISDTPAMILDPIDAADMAGVRAYDKQPIVGDSFNRGELTGKRIDSMTYMFEQPGKVRLPNLRLQWWDLDSQALKTIELDGMELEISPAEQTNAETITTDTADAKADLKRIVAMLVGLVAVVAIVIRYHHSWIAIFDRWRKRMESSERSYFQRFVSTALKNDPKQTLRELMRWLDTTDVRDPAPRLDRFLNLYGDDEARRQVSALEAAVDSQSDTWNAGQLVVSMKRARSQWLAEQRKRRRTAENPLPPLRTP